MSVQLYLNLFIEAADGKWGFCDEEPIKRARFRTDFVIGPRELGILWVQFGSGMSFVEL